MEGYVLKNLTTVAYIKIKAIPYLTFTPHPGARKEKKKNTRFKLRFAESKYLKLNFCKSQPQEHYIKLDKT